MKKVQIEISNEGLELKFRDKFKTRGCRKRQSYEREKDYRERKERNKVKGEDKGLKGREDKQRGNEGKGGERREKPAYHY